MVKFEVKQYIARQLTEQAKILKLSACDQNGEAYLKRYFYYCLDKHVRSFLEKGGEPHWLMMPGLRGVGKATVGKRKFITTYEKNNHYWRMRLYRIGTY